MVNFGPLTAELGSGVWGTPTNFNGFCAEQGMGQMGHENRMGHMGHGSLGVDP